MNQKCAIPSLYYTFLTKRITNLAIFILIGIMASAPCWALQINDPAGDTTITDITGMRYEVNNNALEILLTFGIIYSDTFVTIKIDSDKSLVTGFAGGCGFREPSPFGVDYIIRIETGSLPISTEAYLTYEKFISNPNDPITETTQIKTPIGDPVHPNGTVFTQTGSQMYLKIPLSLFNSEPFPLYTSNTKTCVRNLFPSSNATPNLARAYINVRTETIYFLQSYDQLPDRGMIDTETGSIADCYPLGSQDLIASINDPPNDSILSGILGDEITALSAFRHKDGNLSFLFQLSSLESSDDSQYVLNFDIDDNASTGLQVSNGAVILGADITAQFFNWGLINPIGKFTPLYGDISFGNDLFCTVPYSHLGYSWTGNPGYIWITLPKEFSQPWISSNRSGVIKILGSTLSPAYPHGFFEDSCGAERGSASF